MNSLYVAILLGSCSNVESEEKNVLLLYEYLKKCDSTSENFIPPPPPNPSNSRLNLAVESCFELVADENIFYYQDKADSIRGIRNCFLLLEEYYFEVVDIPQVTDTCYWHPELCTKRVPNFPDQYIFLKRNTRTSWHLISEYMWLYDSSKYAYEWYCKLVPFPCVDSTFLGEVKGESIEIICFHDYTHCYMIGADSIPRYIVQRSVEKQ